VNPAALDLLGALPSPAPIMSDALRDLLGLSPGDAAPIAADDPATVAALRRRLWAAGYRPLAVRTGGKAPAGLAWQNRARRDPPEAAIAPADADTLNTGILCDGLRVLDIDVDDDATAGRIEALAVAWLGAAPVRCRDNSGRRALVYRAAEGEPGKRELAGTAGKVEVLGRGQHVLAFGLHPSGAPLRWRAAPLEAVQRANLHAVTEEALTGFLAAVAPIIGAGAAEASAPNGERGAADPAGLLAPSPELLAEAIAHAPNDGSREGWIRMGHAIKAAGGTLDQWAEWSERHQPEDSEDLARRWAGFTPPFAAGWPQIGRLARAAGWLGAVQHEFGPAVALLHQQAEAAACERRFGRLRLRRVADAAEAEPRDYLVKQLMARGEFSVWWGAPKAGKSFLVLYAAWCIALGHAFMGFKVKRRRRVLYIAAEGEGGFNGRVQALAREIGDPGESFRFIAQPVMVGPPGNDLRDVIAAARDMGADLIVVDTLARTFGDGDENTAQDMNGFIAKLDMLRAETGAHVLVIHHGRKDGGDLRGSGALAAAADLILKVERGAAQEPSAATVERAKDDADGRSFGFKLRAVSLGTDEDGDPRWTCIAEPAALAAGGPGSAPKGVAAAVLDRIAEIATAEGVAPESVETGGARAIGRDRLRESCEHRPVSDAAKPDSREKALRRALMVLDRAGHIGTTADWVWIRRRAGSGAPSGTAN